MIRNKLNVLLAERNLTIKDVYENTGLSRTTISNMVNGLSDGLQLKTLDTLCNYLEITPSDFFEYSPYIYTFKSVLNTNEGNLLSLEFKQGENTSTEWLSFYISDKPQYEEILPFALKDHIDLYCFVYPYDGIITTLQKFFDNLSIGLKNVFKTELNIFLLDTIINNFDLSEYTKAKNELTILIDTPISNSEETIKVSNK